MKKLVVLSLLSLGVVALADVPETPIYSCAVKVNSKSCGSATFAVPSFPQSESPSPDACNNVHIFVRRYDPSRSADPTVGVFLTYKDANGNLVASAGMRSTLSETFSVTGIGKDENNGPLILEATCKVTGYNK